MFVEKSQNWILAATSNQNRQKEVQVQERLPNQVDIYETLITQGGGIIAFLFFWVSLLILASKKLKSVSDNQLDLCTKHRCHKCQYFVKNHFLNCAVQPSLVLTEEANNCSDYYPKSKKM
jgi:hypothetical protein